MLQLYFLAKTLMKFIILILESKVQVIFSRKNFNVAIASEPKVAYTIEL